MFRPTADQMVLAGSRFLERLLDIIISMAVVSLTMDLSWTFKNTSFELVYRYIRSGKKSVMGQTGRRKCYRGLFFLGMYVFRYC